MFIKSINSRNAPEALGPYSPAVKLGDFVYLSGQIPLDPQTGEIVGDTIQDQTHQVMKNIKAILNEMGLGFHHIVKTTIFIKDLDDLEELNKIYISYFNQPYPARSCIEVSRLPKNARIEIECMAIDTLAYESQFTEENECSNCSGGCGCHSCGE